MKRLTKDERIGATAIVLVALVVCVCSLFVNRRNRSQPSTDELVKTIILSSDSSDNDKEEYEERGGKGDVKRNSDKKSKRKRKTGGKSKKGVKKKETKKESKKESKKGNSAPSRDFLSDPV